MISKGNFIICSWIQVVEQETGLKEILVVAEAEIEATAAVIFVVVIVELTTARSQNPQNA